MSDPCIATVPCLVAADDVAVQRWQNGGGRTRELLCGGGDGSAGWRWRISLADIDADGPFSAFPGVQRWFAVLDGAGVALQFGSRCQRLTPDDDALAFDGAAAPHCRLLGGPTRDLNLMLRGVRGTLQRARPGQPWLADWPLRGRFDSATRTLLWGLGAGPLLAPAAGWWIGIAR